MSTVVVDISMSLDGFVTAPGDGQEFGLGIEGEALHYWVFGGPWTYDGPREFARDNGGAEAQIFAEFDDLGAGIVGRRMYDAAGGWGGHPPFGPTFVLTSHVEDDLPGPETGFHFVSSFDEALASARELVGDKAISVGGGAATIQQALRAGVVEQVNVHVAPVILGAGRTLFGVLGQRIDLEPIRVLESPWATHLRYRVVGQRATPGL